MSILAGLNHAAHVWYAEPGTITAASRIRRYQSILSTDETERYRRLRFAADRHHYLISRALVRHVLSRYADVAPEAWQFTANQYGRPEIAVPDGIPPLRFNLTHTPGLVACTVTLKADCGIDAEKITARGTLRKVAKRLFADEELTELRKLEGQRFLQRFFTYWTLREAYCKARGIPLLHLEKDFFFSVTANEQIGIHYATDTEHPDDHWLFTLIRPTPDHIVAVAVDRRGSRLEDIVSRPAAL